MDDVQNISAPLYGKAEPTTAKTTMSVRKMQHLLGLGKTDSYWLLHKNFFEVILINDKMRIVISSFEKWYANQVKYHKVNGPPPGEELCKRSYSILEVAEILKVNSDTVYTLIRQGKLKAETVDFWMRMHSVLMISSTSIMAQSLKCPIKQRSPSLKTVRSMPTRQQHLPNCWLTPLWPNSSKILQRTYKPLYIHKQRQLSDWENCRCLFLRISWLN